MKVQRFSFAILCIGNTTVGDISIGTIVAKKMVNTIAHPIQKTVQVMLLEEASITLGLYQHRQNGIDDSNDTHIVSDPHKQYAIIVSFEQDGSANSVTLSMQLPVGTVFRKEQRGEDYHAVGLQRQCRVLLASEILAGWKRMRFIQDAPLHDARFSVAATITIPVSTFA